MTTIERSTRFIRAASWPTYAVTQFWQPGLGVRRDLFAWMDVLAFDGHDWIGIQACTSSDRLAHVRRYQADPAVTKAIKSWMAIECHKAQICCWSRRKVKRGGQARRWHRAVPDLSMEILF